MAVQAGIWHFDDRPADSALLQRTADMTAPYAPEGYNTLLLDSVGMVYGASHTTKESRLESQPHRFGSGDVMMWDGRLDNREELLAELGGACKPASTDVEIAAAMFLRRGTGCFAKLIGDWAITIWDASEKELILARDCMAVRHLYYYSSHEKIFWCTQLAPLVQLSGSKFTLNDEYIAGYISLHAEARMTPYKQIKAVPPASFVTVRHNHCVTHAYWVFEPKDPARFKTDAEYEMQYRHFLRQSIRRRLRTDAPILAELSGGYDSSSIVCVADDILAREGAEAPRLDTVSHFDLAEPEADDHLYFTKVEEQRGRKGFHIDVEASGTPFVFGTADFCATPRGHIRDASRMARRKIVEEGGHRVVLSGLGGDELNGQAVDCGVLLGDMLAELRLGTFVTQLKAWSLLMKQPWMGLFYRTLLHLVPSAFRARLTRYAQPESWINRNFFRRQRMSRRKLGLIHGSKHWRPSARDWDATLCTLAGQMGEDLPSTEEKRYPYLDRDLVDFLTCIPVDQLLRPGHRRSLMRRALIGYLPKEILARRTKAGAGRVFSILIEKHWNVLEDFAKAPVGASLGYFDTAGFHEALHNVKSGNISANISDFLRGITVEYWLRDLAKRGLISVPDEALWSLKMDFVDIQA